MAQLHRNIKIKPQLRTSRQKQVKVPAPKPVAKKPKFKPNQNSYIDVLLDNGVKKLYHFTDRSNLDSIRKQGGLYSWDYMYRNKIPISRQGGDQLSKMLDTRRGLQNYVRLSVCNNHPMMFHAKKEKRLIEPVILEIDPAVVTWYQTLFADRNANSNEHLRGTSLEALKRIHFESCLKPNPFELDDNEKPFYQAEILVWEFVPSKYILNLNKI